MLKSVKIENFRGLESFELQQLGRVNLLVGTNNSGKTSILEAIQLLCSRTNLEPLIETMSSRGEYSVIEMSGMGGRSLRDRLALDISNLFYGYEVKSGSKLIISGDRSGGDEAVILSLMDVLFDDVEELVDEREGLIDDEMMKLVVQWKHSYQGDKTEERSFALTPDLSLRADNLRRFRKDTSISSINVQFVTPFSLPADRMIEIFEEKIVLTPDEDVINQALFAVEPRIERIAPISSRKNSYARSNVRAGFLVKLSGTNQRVPIGSMGDGIWRMLGLALSAVGSKGGVLLVDEIDTGLHFTVMVDMWRMIWQTAQRLDVQVFATTHSRDCWESLAEVAQAEDMDSSEIIIHRIERNKSTGVTFNKRQMVIASEREIEIR